MYETCTKVTAYTVHAWATHECILYTAMIRMHYAHKVYTNNFPV